MVGHGKSQTTVGFSMLGASKQMDPWDWEMFGRVFVEEVVDIYIVWGRHLLEI